MSESAVERTGRALDLIPFIARNPGWSVAELAERFETSPSQIMKDLEMLFVCGLPGYSHLELIDLELDSDYVAVKNPQNLVKPRKFTFSEVVALILGFDALIPQIPDESLRNRATHLQSILRQHIYEQSPSALILDSPGPPSGIDLLMAETIESGGAVEIEYRSAHRDSLSKRTIFPRDTYRENGHLYTVAFCELTHEIRHFRNDRIVAATLLQLAESPQLQSADREPQGSHEIHVLLSGENRFFVEENPRIISSIIEQEDRIRATFSLEDRSWLVKALLSLPGSVQILGPESFLDLFNSKIDAILDLYR
jgi:proteasome accessory factor C